MAPVRVNRDSSRKVDQAGSTLEMSKDAAKFDSAEKPLSSNARRSRQRKRRFRNRKRLPGSQNTRYYRFFLSTW